MERTDKDAGKHLDPELADRISALEQALGESQARSLNADKTQNSKFSTKFAASI
jgi:hypothetical protein